MDLAAVVSRGRHQAAIFWRSVDPRGKALEDDTWARSKWAWVVHEVDGG